MNITKRVQGLGPYLVITLVIVTLLSFQHIVLAQSKPSFELYAEAGQTYGVDPQLLKAIAKVETNEHPGAVNIDDPSFGLMQVLCEPNRLGVCTNGFPAVKGWAGMTVKKLLKPKINISIAAQILSWNLEHYGYPRGIAVYNCWSSRKDPIEGPFRNQEYVDKVMYELTKMEVQSK